MVNISNKYFNIKLLLFVLNHQAKKLKKCCTSPPNATVNNKNTAGTVIMTTNMRQKSSYEEPVFKSDGIKKRPIKGIFLTNNTTLAGAIL